MDALTQRLRELVLTLKAQIAELRTQVAQASSSSGGLTNDQLRASPVPVSGSFSVTGGLTNTELRATAVPVSLSGTLPVSVASLPLPTGAATAAKQPAVGTAGAPASDILTVQGIASMTALKVDGSGVTQPVSGTVGISGTVPVSGTFWQATQPVSIAATVAVSGPITDAQMRASPVPISGTVTATGAEASATFRGRVSTFRTPGRAGTTGQKIFALHNATGSSKIVHINQLTVDCIQAAVIASTVIPPIIRVYRFTAVPTNGTALTKVAKDTALSSNASVTAWGDASADGTNSSTALTIALGSVLTQEFAPRLITAAGYEMFDRTDLLDGFDIVLRPLEGICIMLDYSTTTANPTSTHWVATADWFEL